MAKHGAGQVRTHASWNKSKKRGATDEDAGEAESGCEPEPESDRESMSESD
jgi:hypothetical protein